MKRILQKLNYTIENFSSFTPPHHPNNLQKTPNSYQDLWITKGISNEYAVFQLKHPQSLVCNATIISHSYKSKRQRLRSSVSRVRILGYLKKKRASKFYTTNDRPTKKKKKTNKKKLCDQPHKQTATKTKTLPQITTQKDEKKKNKKKLKMNLKKNQSFNPQANSIQKKKIKKFQNGRWVILYEGDLEKQKMPGKCFLRSPLTQEPINLTFLKIVPLESLEKTTNFSIYSVSFEGVANKESKQRKKIAKTKFKSQRAVNSILPYLRTNGYFEIFRELEKRYSHPKFENPIIGQLFQKLVLGGDWPFLESKFFTVVHSKGLFKEFLSKRPIIGDFEFLFNPDSQMKSRALQNRGSPSKTEKHQILLDSGNQILYLINTFNQSKKNESINIWKLELKKENFKQQEQQQEQQQNRIQKQNEIQNQKQKEREREREKENEKNNFQYCWDKVEPSGKFIPKLPSNYSSIFDPVQQQIWILAGFLPEHYPLFYVFDIRTSKWNFRYPQKASRLITMLFHNNRQRNLQQQQQQQQPRQGMRRIQQQRRQMRGRMQLSRRSMRTRMRSRNQNNSDTYRNENDYDRDNEDDDDDYGGGGDDDDDDDENGDNNNGYNESKNKPKQSKLLLEIIKDHKMVIDSENRMIYIYGGINNNFNYFGLYSFNMNDNEWKLIRDSDEKKKNDSSILKSRCYHGMVLLKKQYFLNQNSHSQFGCNEKNIPMELCNGDNFLIILGGIESYNNLPNDKIICYDISNDKVFPLLIHGDVPTRSINLSQSQLIQSTCEIVIQINVNYKSQLSIFSLTDKKWKYPKFVNLQNNNENGNNNNGNNNFNYNNGKINKKFNNLKNTNPQNRIRPDIIVHPKTGQIWVGFGYEHDLKKPPQDRFFNDLWKCNLKKSTGNDILLYSKFLIRKQQAIEMLNDPNVSQSQVFDFIRTRVQQVAPKPIFNVNNCNSNSLLLLPSKIVLEIIFGNNNNLNREQIKKKRIKLFSELINFFPKAMIPSQYDLEMILNN
ncbi:muskelin [Anaeramoeba flamelloides]|uniref:Muskelin n=1 Tax=Anaeramoeba flamelloides TaxID=1746091 RepID=A0AAV7ZPS6_9EUKA|nr:muskelin [Anaeramoeba flamelloides]